MLRFLHLASKSCFSRDNSEGLIFFLFLLFMYFLDIERGLAFGDSLSFVFYVIKLLLCVSLNSEFSNVFPVIVLPFLFDLF